MTLPTLLFGLGKVLGVLVLPPWSLILLASIGLWLLPRRPRLGRGLIGAGLLLVLVLSLPWFSHRLLGLVEQPCGLAPDETAEAIVVLGGGVRRIAPDYGGVPTVSIWTLERLRYAAQLQRQTGVPILVTGGAPEGGVAEGPLMRQILESEFGVPVRWVEDRSLTSRENARNSAPMLKVAGIRQIYLVSQGWHLPRGIAEFERHGLRVVPAATGCEPPAPMMWLDLLPNPQSLAMSYWAFHEGLGRLWYALLDWVDPMPN
jgi:uncharacterized SAM-binding protein YcdF (DUF218 family)